jgi:hypothetical protein
MYPAISARSAVFSGSALKRRWIATFGFGLAHGFGLSLALRPALRWRARIRLTAMLSFNAGVELGQLLVLVLLIPLALLFRHVIGGGRVRSCYPALAGHTAWRLDGRSLGAAQEVHVRVAGDRRGVSGGDVALDVLLVVAAALYWLFFGVLPDRI